MHIRRAVLLFAIVLALSAVAASISPPSRQTQAPQGATTETTTETPPRPTLAPPRTVAMQDPAGRRRPELRVTGEGHVTLDVSTETPGEVNIAALDLTQPAEPGTAATFDLYLTSAGRYPVTFTPADATRAAPVGVLVIRG